MDCVSGEVSSRQDVTLAMSGFHKRKSLAMWLDTSGIACDALWVVRRGLRIVEDAGSKEVVSAATSL